MCSRRSCLLLGCNFSSALGLVDNLFPPPDPLIYNLCKWEVTRESRGCVCVALNCQAGLSL